MLKLPRGTQDYTGESFERLSYLKGVIEKIFLKYNGQFIETPVFELTDVLLNKYGDEEKLIYNLENTDDAEDIQIDVTIQLPTTKERLSLRYDHTVPLVRYCIVNKIDKMRRCCIGKVYRREATTRSQVRLREFYQGDFDYVGRFDSMLPEFEIFCMIQELFNTIGVTDYQIIYNYRQNLDYYIRESGIDPNMFSSVCSSIDKLDKKDPEYIRTELTTKGLEVEQIDKLFTFLFSENIVMDEHTKSLDDKFNRYLSSVSFIDKTKIVLLPTLARGSDYYTGIIFEVKHTSSEITSSVVGGGRYDKLIPSYKKNKNEKETEFPMIGFSFGIDRLLSFVKVPSSNKNVRVWVSTIGNVDDSVKIKLDIVSRLYSKGYSVFYNLSDRKFKKEIRDSDENSCRFIVIVGTTEWEQNKVTIRNMDKREQVTIDFNDIDRYFETLNH